ncbi:MAG: triose-phosphate isomerase [Colwellia sp.]|nr:triose-phosphate isomerase [Colwellia sp.]
MKQTLIIANWKMNGSIVANSKLLMAMLKFNNKLKNTELVICPPFPYLHQVKEYIVGSNIKLGAQNVNENNSGAFTGEVSADMLKEFYCRYVLIGHSERRALFQESNGLIAKKINQTIDVGLTPVLCIGESLAQRENGDVKAVILEQLSCVVNEIDLKKFKSVVIAYEPIWAIGTGQTASPEQAQKVHRMIRQYIYGLDPILSKNISILYGGSVNEINASELLKQKDIDGFLVGGASLKSDSLETICKLKI